MLVKIGYPLLQYKEIDYNDDFERNVILTYNKDEEQKAFNNGFNRILNEMYKRQDIFNENNIEKDYGKYNLSEFECLLYDVNDNTLTHEKLHEIVNNNKMAILRININPESLDYDTESDLRYWKDNSKRLLDDKTLDNKTVLKNLEGKDLIVYLNNSKIRLLNCKIIQIYNGRYNYYFALLIEKANIIH